MPAPGADGQRSLLTSSEVELMETSPTGYLDSGKLLTSSEVELMETFLTTIDIILMSASDFLGS